MKLLKEDKRGKVFEANGFKVFYRNKDSVSGDNSINDAEQILLIVGSANVEINGKVSILDAPANIFIPEKTPHKITAITDISFIVTYPA